MEKRLPGKSWVNGCFTRGRCEVVNKVVSSILSMTIDSNRKKRQLTNSLRKFSSSSMSNAKWTKVFRKLSENSDLVTKCLIKDIYDDFLRQVFIPPVKDFSSEFNGRGLQDGRNQPYQFKEIEWLEFPSKWIVRKEMRGQILEPQKFEQNISKIKTILQEVGELELELDNEKLILYGYKGYFANGDIKVN